MNTEGARLGKVKFYDAKKGFGFVRDLTIADYTEREDDTYIGSSATPYKHLADGEYVVFEKAPSTTKSGTFEARSIRRISDFEGNLDSLIDAVASPEEENSIRHQRELGVFEWQIGQVKFFDSEKGFGFIKSLASLDGLDQKDVYVNERAVRSGVLTDDEYVAFQLIPSQGKSGEYQATRVNPVDELKSVSKSLAQKLAVWTAGEGELSSAPSVIAGAVSQMSVGTAEQYIAHVARECNDRSSDMANSIIRTLGGVLQEADGNDQFSDEAATQAWDAYQTEVRRLVAKEKVSPSVEESLWLDGQIKTISFEAVERAITSASPRRVKQIVRRLDTGELAEWVSNQAERLDAFDGNADDAEQVLDGQLTVLKAFRQERLDDAADVVSDYQRTVGDFAQASYEKGLLSNEVALGLWENDVMDRLSDQTFFWGIDRAGSVEERSGFLAQLKAKRRRQFVIQRTRALVKERKEEGTPFQKLVDWMMGVQAFVQNTEGDEGSSRRDLYSECTVIIREQCLPEDQFALFSEGVIETFPQEWVVENVTGIDRSDLEPVLRAMSESTAGQLLTKRLEALPELEASQVEPGGEENEELRWIIKQSRMLLSKGGSTALHAAVVDRVDLFIHVNLYREDLLQVDPQPAIERYLSELDLEKIQVARDWVEEDVLSGDAFVDALEAYLRGTQLSGRATARCAREAALEAENHRPGLLQRVKFGSSVSQMLARLVLWLEGHDVAFKLEALQAGLRWLEAEDQVKALRKAFYLHATNQVTLTPERLSACSDFRVGQSDSGTKAGGQRENRPPLGLSAEIIIQTMEHVESNGSFLREGGLIEAALNATRDKPSRKLELQNIFNKCRGRTVSNWRWDRTYMTTRRSSDSDDQKQLVERENNGRRYFLVLFPYNKQLVREVKRLPGRKYYSNNKCWTVPAERDTHRAAALAFARRNNFFIKLKDGKHKTNNLHLFEKVLQGQPYGVTYCEGRKAKKKYFGKIEFWWCRGRPCYQSCHGRHDVEEWQAYTMEDFLYLLGLTADEEVGDEVVEMGQYHRFLGWLNRFDQLLDRMYCRDCGHILHPKSSSNYAHYRVTYFHCANSSCARQNEGVYLHHCFNPRCGSVIDSRDSHQCPNDWWICTNHNCGACCSHKEMEGRMERLNEVGRQVPRALVKDVEGKVGHVERAEHFCYECGTQMEQKCSARST